MTHKIMRTKWLAGVLAVVALSSWSPAWAEVRIVCIGDSNIAGKGVSSSEAYPAQLERALRARGIDATVTNAGISGDTTTGVLARLDSSVPNGTDVAVLSIGVNDVVLHGASVASTRANADEIVRRLRARGIDLVRVGTGKQFQGSIANDPKYHVEGGSGPKPGTTEWHLTGQGYAMVTARTLPQVMAAIARTQKRKKM
jgi:lysophospholipase L1-like esterase